MTESRKQFEEWAKENLGCDLSHNGEHYNHTWAYYAWKGWQASRTAIVVKLGSAQNTSFEEWQVYHEDEIKDELERIGVRYE